MQRPSLDEEKGIRHPPVVEASASDAVNVESRETIASASHTGGFFRRLNNRLSSFKLFESRGIERIPLEERHYVKAADYMQMTLLWLSTNMTANNMALGMMGPLSYSLGFVDSALCATFGALLGAAGVAYMGTFGPASGNRTMV